MNKVLFWSLVAGGATLAAAVASYAPPAHAQEPAYAFYDPTLVEHHSDAEATEITVWGHRYVRDSTDESRNRNGVTTTVDNTWGQGRVENTRTFVTIGGAQIGSITTGNSPSANSQYTAAERTNDVPQPRIVCTFPLSESCLRGL